MTEQELAEMDARVEAASPGPWRWSVNPSAMAEDVGSIDAPGGRVCWFGDQTQYYPCEGEPPSASDLAFIIAARADVPALIAEVRRLRELVAGGEYGTEQMCPWCRGPLLRRWTSRWRI